jgi:hypothetical protein
MNIHRNGDLQLGPDPIGATDKYWMAQFIEACVVECTKVPNVGENTPIERRADKRLDTGDQLIARGDVDTSG